MDNWLNLLETELLTLQEQQQYRSLSLSQGVDFSSNDYLGMNTEDKLRPYALRFLEAQEKVLGSTGSRLLTGNSLFHEQAEAFFQQHFEVPAALIVNSGYDANIAILSSLPSRHDVILYDEKVHASIKDGMRLSYATNYSVAHNKPSYLKKKINLVREKHPRARIFYVFETVYSMDGDIAPVSEIVTLAKEFDLILIADEAHAMGVFGTKGEGVLQSLNLHHEVAIRMCNFGKANGVSGAIILTQPAVKQYLINKARSIIYTTSISPFQIYLMQTSTQLIAENKQWKMQLWRNIQLFQEYLTHLPIHSAIIPIPIAGNETVKKAAKTLQQAGFDVRPILSPTVAKGKERLRICVHSFNTHAHIEQFCEKLNKIC